jgi:hypothetical protein
MDEAATFDLHRQLTGGRASAVRAVDKRKRPQLGGG